MKTAKRKYMVLLILALFFAAPGISAYVFYHHPQWLGSGKTNKGTLLNPPVLLTQLASQFSKPEAKWALVLWSPRACEKNCIKQLDKLARIRLALGRHLYEVESILLLGADAPDLSEALVKVMKEQDIRVLKLREQVVDAPLLQQHLGIFIANHDDYLVLAYQPKAKSKDIYHDIRQLLNMSK